MVTYILSIFQYLTSTIKYYYTKHTMATQLNALLALLFITFLPSTSSSNVATKYNTNNDTSVPFKKYMSTNAVKKNKQWNHHPFKNKYTQGPSDLNLPSSTKEDTCPSIPTSHPIKIKTTKKKNKNRSGGGINFDAFFFPFTFNFNESSILIYEDVIYSGLNGIMQTDNIKMNLITKKIEIFMNSSRNKVKIISN